MLNYLPTLLIVDDEEPMRNELERIDWVALGVKKIGAAENGKDALAFCKDNPVDIVICDIEMPVMNGLEFVEKLKAFSADTQVILLTCHTAFEYAQSAIKLDVVDYVLKTLLDTGDMRIPIEKALAKIKENQSLQQIKAGKNRREIEIAAMTSYQDGKIIPALMQNISVPSYYIALQHTNPLFSSYISSSIYFLIENSLKLSCVFYAPGKYLVNLKTAQKKQAEKNLLAIITAIVQDLSTIEIIENAQIEFFATKEMLVSDEQGLLTVFAMGEQAEESFFYCKNPILTPRSFQANPSSAIIAQLSGIIANGQLGEPVKQFCMQHGIHSSLLKSLLIKKHGQKVAMGTAFDGFVNCISLCTSYDALEDYLTYYLDNKGPGKPKRQEITDALAIIHDRYSTNLTLGSLAMELELSPNYLGKLFKETEGKSFQDYLNEYRIAKAKELIIGTNQKIYAISEQVGFTSYRYFSIVFKNITNKTPSDYRVY